MGAIAQLAGAVAAGFAHQWGMVASLGVGAVASGVQAYNAFNPSDEEKLNRLSKKSEEANKEKLTA